MKVRLILAVAVAVVVPAFAIAQTSGSEEDVQFRSIDFATQILELHNYGSSSWALDGWRFCSHDVSDGFDYTSSGGLDGITLAAGESLNVHWNNDASGANAINISALGGQAVDDLSVNGIGDGISINIYRDGNFGSSASMIDHIQYSFDGADVGGSSNPRGGVAVGASLWSATSDWVSVGDSTTALILADDPFPGASGGTHTGSSYTAVPEPSTIFMMILGFVGFASGRRRN
jgi:hypothetical protein